MKHKILSIQILILVIFFSSLSFSQEYSLLSPDKKNEIKINTGKEISFSVYSNNNELISPSPISLELENGKNPGNNSVIINSRHCRLPCN